MRVLAVNKFYFVKGGTERYFFELKRVLERHGDEVVPFAMRDDRNEPSRYSDYFVSHVDFETSGPLSDARAAMRVIYSVEARRKIEALAEATRPDIAHLHNIAHQLSPSIIPGLNSRGVPVVQTLHDYKLVCPSYQMMVDGDVCERCGDGMYLEAVRRRCMQGSLARSLTVCAEAYLHRFLGTYARGVQVFIAPSRSLRDRMIEHGVPAEKIVHLPNMIAMEEYEPRYESSGYAVYVGRLSAGKGVGTMLRAVSRSGDVRLRVVGTGPLEEDFMTEARDLGLDNVEFMGYRTGEDLKAIVGDALFVVVPSECLENSPLVVYEALALGKAVIGSRIGGIPELVDEGRTGLLFPPGEADELAAAMEKLVRDPARAIEMGRAGRRKMEEQYAPERHYRGLREIYERATA